MDKIFFLLGIILINSSCTAKKDKLEIYLTKNYIRSKKGISPEVLFSDSAQLAQSYNTYGVHIKFDLVSKRALFMQPFAVTHADLQATPFITSDEIIALYPKEHFIEFKNSVTQKLKDSLSNWNTDTVWKEGKQFAICYNDSIIQTGYIVPFANQNFTPETYQIGYFPFSKDATDISHRYLFGNMLQYNENQLRTDPGIQLAFKNRMKG